MLSSGKVVVFGQKFVVIGQSYYSGKWLYLGKNCFNRAKWLYSGKVVVIGKMLLHSGKSGCIRTKVVVF